MLNALWKYYGHCAAQLCKSRLLTKLKGQTVRQPALSLAACFPVSQVHLVNLGTEQRIAQHCCSESVFPTPSISSRSSQSPQGSRHQWTPAGEAVVTNASQLTLKDGKESAISWELLVVYKSCRTLWMDGESSETMCEQLALWKYLLREESRPRAFFSFSLAGLQANE